jgi:thiamine biosynthesis lipoprotein
VNWGQSKNSKRVGVFTLTPILFLCLVLATGCQRYGEQSAQLFVFGTVVEVKLWNVSPEHANQAFTELQDMFTGMHSDWHAWEPGLLVDINRAFSEGRTATTNADIVTMVRRSQDIEAATGGRFNPAIGGLIRLWGFHTSEYPIIGPPPTQQQIDELLSQHPSSLDIHINGLEMRSDNPLAQLDFGGVAKGHAVDLAIGRLKELGIGNAIVNAGGDLRAMGDHGDRPWRVAVRKPGGGSIGSIEVQGDEAIFTSGNYERFREDKTERYQHILDPGTGWPAEDIASVTLITDDGLLADAAATALVVAGLDEWIDVARALNLDQVAVVDEAGVIHLTPAMKQRIHFPNYAELEIIETKL